MSSSSSTTSWTCPTCTLLNSADKRRCDICNSRKPLAVGAAPQQQAASVVASTAASPNSEPEPESTAAKATVDQKVNNKKATTTTTTSCSTTLTSSPNNDNHEKSHADKTGKTDTSTTVVNTTPAALPIMTPTTETTTTPTTDTPNTITKNKNETAERKNIIPESVPNLTPSPNPLIVYHHVIAGWHDTHASSTEIGGGVGGGVRYYDLEDKDQDNNINLFPVINPATNQPSLYYQETSNEAFDYALNQATAIQQQYYFKNNNNDEKSESIVDKAGWWSNPTKSYQRADILMKIADILGKNTDRLADLEVHQIGRPRKEMRFQLSRLPEWFVYYASLLRVGGCGGSEDTTPPFGGDHINIVKRIPLGVVAQITPFNHPLLIAVKKLAPALAAGNCCILKPSEQAPASIIELAILCIEAGVPDGVITVILGGRNVGEMLVRDSRIRKVDFTGGPKAGYEIGSAAGRNVCQMTQELGGKAPMIVFAPKDLLQRKRRQKRFKKSEEISDIIDIDNLDEYLDPIINGCAFGAFIASGQTCIAGTRLLVQRDIYSLVCEKMTQKIKSFQMGDPFDMNTTFGPMINTKQMDFVHSTVTSCVDGGDENNYNLKLLCGGKRYQRFTGNETYLNEGNWYEPTLVAYSIDDDDDDGAKTSHDRKKNITDVHHNCALFQSELFGPVLSMVPFEDEDHAIQLANDSPFSLGCSIWTHDLVQAHTVSDRVRAGIIWINDHHKNSPASPWGGLTKESGVGRENGREALLEYSQSKSVVIRTKPFDSDWFKDPNARYN